VRYRVVGLVFFDGNLLSAFVWKFSFRVRASEIEKFAAS